MRYSSRFFLYAPLAGLLLLAGIAMVHWWIVASAWAKYLDAVNGHEVMPGVRISFAEKRLAGFPFRMDTILRKLRIEVAEIGGPIIWTSDGFALHVLTYGPVQGVLEAAGRQTLSWHDAAGGTHSFAFLPATFRASSLLRGGKLVRFDCEIVDLDGAEFRAADAQLHFRTAGDGLDLYAKLQGAHVSGGYAGSLGPDIASLIASGRANRGAALDRVLRGDEAPEAAFDRWRNSGGTIQMSAFTLVRKGGSLTYTGRLALDDTHDLSGTLRARDGTALNFTGNHIARWDVLP